MVAYSSSPDFYPQLYMDKESGKCAETHVKFGPMDQWPLVLQSSGPPWARISHLHLSSYLDSPKPPELSTAPLRPPRARADPRPHPDHLPATRARARPPPATRARARPPPSHPCSIIVQFPTVQFYSFLNATPGPHTHTKHRRQSSPRWTVVQKKIWLQTPTECPHREIWIIMALQRCQCLHVLSRKHRFSPRHATS